MRKTFIAVAVSLLALTGGAAFAQSQQVVLPSAGLTPDSPFYFLDRLGENIQQFFTFGAESKAKLQIEFAGERISEIKVMVEKKGPQDKGIDKAKELLLSNVAYAAEMVNQEKASGKDVAQLAKDIDDQFDARDQLLVQTFLDAQAKLAAEHKKIQESLLKKAQAAGDTAKVAELTQQLNDIQNQANNLKDEKDKIKNDFRAEQKNIEQNMNQEDQQQDQQEQIEEDKQEQKEEQEIENEQEEKTEAIEKEEANEQEKKSENEQGTSTQGQIQRGNNKTNNQEGKENND